MKRLNRWVLVAGTASAMCFGANALAQQDNQGGGAGGRGGRGNFDPAQMRERMMERVKEQMEITDDSEWKAIQPLIQKVMDARMATMAGGGRGMFGGPRRGGGGGDNNGGDQGGMRRGPFGQPSPEVEALQKAIESKASNADLKTAMAKVADARKTKQADLEKAQADLRKVLSVRQEAIATANGWL